MALIEIPPFVRADEDPPTCRTPVRGFHLRSYQLLEPVDFPRDLFQDALAEHARLLEAHAAEILSAPLDHAGKPIDDRFVAFEDMHFCATLLASDGKTHEIHKWPTVDLSYVVHRCRGIVRQLMEMPAEGCSYVVVVARGVASLQLLRGLPPLRAGEAPRHEIVERDLAVEPWEQWHLRWTDFVATWWLTPAGDLVASRVRVRPWPGSAREVTDALMTLRGRAVRRRLDAHAREHPRRRAVAILDTSVRGEEITISDRRDGDPFIKPFPEIVEALRVGREGLDPVVVYDHHWAALCWLPVATATDVAVPQPLVVKRTPAPSDAAPDDEDEDDDADGTAKPPPKIRLGPNAYLLALFDDFRPVDPWMPPPSEVHAAWRSGIALFLYAGALVPGTAVVIRGWDEDPLIRWLLVPLTFVFLCILGLGSLFRSELAELQPARRERRYRAWKQVHDELQQGTKPQKREPRKPGRKYWMRRLAERLARLERLTGLGAPEIIVEHERNLVRSAVAELEKSDADAVLAAWPTAVRHMESREARREARKKGTDKPN